jgi:hypothetical protein
MGPWARAFAALQSCHPSQGTVTELRIEPSLASGTVDGRPASVSAAPIPAGVWAAIDGHVVTDRQSEQLAQLLEHTWEEPLVPGELVRVGAEEDAAALVRAVAEEIERDPSTLLRFRGYDAHGPTGDDAWRARGELPQLPPPARRPPDSVPKRFGTSGIRTADGDLVETLIRAYAAFSD